MPAMIAQSLLLDIFATLPGRKLRRVRYVSRDWNITVVKGTKFLPREKIERIYIIENEIGLWDGHFRDKDRDKFFRSIGSVNADLAVQTFWNPNRFCLEGLSIKTPHESENVLLELFRLSGRPMFIGEIDLVLCQSKDFDSFFENTKLFQNIVHPRRIECVYDELSLLKNKRVFESPILEKLYFIYIGPNLIWVDESITAQTLIDFIRFKDVKRVESKSLYPRDVFSQRSLKSL
jgi:hypothetical protein